MPNPAPEFLIFPTRAALAREAATRFVAIARESIAARTPSGVEGRFAVALAGGNTPRELYVLLAAPEFAAQIDWARVHLFWGDERAVPPDHSDSNFKMANDALIARVPLPPQNVHRIRAELPPDDAARAYEQVLRRTFGEWDADERRQTQSVSLRAERSNPKVSVEIASAQTPLLAMTEKNPRSSVSIRAPIFDLILLGLGADGHTASLFPHSPALREQTRWVAAQYVEKLQAYRITLAAPVINAARHILFLVAGADKARAVRAVLRGAHRPDDLPAQLVKPKEGQVIWLLDEDAAREL